MNRANLQCEKGYPAGGSSAHRIARLSGYKRRDCADCVGTQCHCHFQKRNRPTMEWIGSQFPLRHRSRLYAERREDNSARTTPGALIRHLKLGIRPVESSPSAESQLAPELAPNWKERRGIEENRRGRKLRKCPTKSDLSAQRGTQQHGSKWITRPVANPASYAAGYFISHFSDPSPARGAGFRSFSRG